MKKLHNFIRNFMLQFDFSKKVAFVLFCSIFAAFYLFINVAITQHSLSLIIRNQLTGIDFHKKVMNIFQKVIDFESTDFIEQDKIQNRLSGKLKTILPLLSSFFEEFNISIQKLDAEKYNFYNYRIQKIKDNLFLTFKTLDDSELQKINIPSYQLTLNKLKNQLINLMDIIKYAYELDKSLNIDNRGSLDVILNKIPLLENSLSTLSKINPQKEFPIFYSEAKKSKIILNETLEVFNLLQQNNREIFNNELMNLKRISTNIEEFTEILNKSNDAKDFNIENLSKTIIAEIPNIYNNLSKNITLKLLEEDRYYHLKQLISGIVLLCGIFVVLTPYLTRAFHNPLAELKVAAEKLASGDLSIRIPIIHSDEVGAVSKSFNQTAEVLEQIMLETDKFATLLSNSTTEIFKTAKVLEDNLHLQEENIHSINQHSKEIAKNTQDFSAGLDIVDFAVHLTAENISQSKDSLSMMEFIMQEMVSSSNNTVVELSSLKTEIDRIFHIIETLVVISDQINLLSLNTAVRANKAGLKKFGFSVIAEKISELSDQTAFATLDIEQIVEQILSYVPMIIKDVDQFGNEIQEALSDSLAVKSHFQRLLMLTQKQISSFRNIQYEMIEQTQKANEIDKSFESLLQSTQKTTRSVRSLYVEIEYLYHSTLNLHKMVKRFVENKAEKE